MVTFLHCAKKDMNNVVEYYNFPSHRVLDNTNICISLEDRLKSVRRHSKIMHVDSGKCLTPCKILKISMSSLSSQISQFTKNVSGPQMIIHFPKWIEISKENVLYTSLSLLAEIGGYVGIFLGYSLLNLADVVYNYTNYRFSAANF